MRTEEHSRIGYHKGLNLSYLHAFQRERGYPRHSHDYYVVAVVDSGLQSFLHGGQRYITPVDGLILLNPGEVHTGEPADDRGYQYRAFYPTAQHLRMAASEAGLSGDHLPAFNVPRVDDPQIAQAVRGLLDTMQNDSQTLESETRFLLTLVDLIRHFGDRPAAVPKSRVEHQAVRKIREYLHDHYAEPVSLAQLAGLVNFSRYYLLHTFRDAVGMPPHLYLESVRIQEAQRLLLEGQPLATIAQQVGFASQSHFTRRFKQIIGVPPGAYARQIRDH